MLSPTPTFTPAQVLVRVRILDQARRVVAEAGTYMAGGMVSSLTLSTERFIPELHRQLVATDNFGTTFVWTGAGDGGRSLPNGFYRFILLPAGGSEVEADFYLEHKPWNAGQVVVVLPPGAPEAIVIWAYSEAVNLRFDLYNLAGERVWQHRATGATGQWRWPLQSTAGQSVANGVYLLKCQASSLDGSVDDFRIIKLAVAR